MVLNLFRHTLALLFPALIILLAWNFAEHAITRGMRLYDEQEILASRLFHPGASWSNLAIYSHMVLGGLLTILAPVQLIGSLRHRFPIIHRITGYVVAVLAVLTGIGGLFYIMWQGTIGGWIMNVGFGLYGVLVVIAAVQTVRLARKRDPRHHDWAYRLIVLALGSWLYRVHYGVWYLLTGGAYSTPNFSGSFDIIQTFAFYIPYLLVLEIWMRSRSDFRSGSFSTM